MPCIMIIDDEESIRDVTRTTLELEGYDVVEAGDGESGIRVFEENEVDLIITDIIMPGMEGIETILELKKRSPEVKIIAISGAGRTGPGEYLKLADRFGANQTLSKPFSRVELLTAVKELLS